MFRKHRRRNKSNSKRKYSANSSSEENTPAQKANRFEIPGNLDISGNFVLSDTESIPDTMAESNITSQVIHESSPQEEATLPVLKEILSEIRQLNIRHDQHNASLQELKTDSNTVKAKLDETIAMNKALNTQVKTLSDKVTLLESKNKTLEVQKDTLTQKLITAESYSKKSNLKFYGIPETQNESTMDLLSKIGDIFRHLGLYFSRHLVDNLHRLPAPFRPRPVIVKFVSYIDRQNVWERKTGLSNFRCNISVREHFAQETEAQMRTLFNIHKAAQAKGHTSVIKGLKLTVDGTEYTPKTLHTLPQDITPEALATQDRNGHILFYNKHSKFSNFHPSKLTVDGIVYTHGEQYIQGKKAKFFNDDDTHQKIMLASSPEEMKALGSKVKSFSAPLWGAASLEIGYEAVLNKFAQNPDLRRALLDTGEKPFIECSRSDRTWGIGFGINDPDLFKKKPSWGKNQHGVNLSRARNHLRNHQATS